MTTTIRSMTPKDADAYLEIRMESVREQPDGYSMDEQIVASAPRSLAESTLEGPPEANGIVLGAFNPGIVGLAGLKLSPRPKARHLATLWGLYVKPSLRRQGIGYSLIQGIAQEAEKIDFLEQIRLMVPSTAAGAISIFQRLGFRKYGCEIRGRKTTLGYHDLDYMQGFLASAPAIDGTGLLRLASKQPGEPENR